jgi:hypothetical protein
LINERKTIQIMETNWTVREHKRTMRRDSKIKIEDQKDEGKQLDKWKKTIQII